MTKAELVAWYNEHYQKKNGNQLPEAALQDMYNAANAPAPTVAIVDTPAEKEAKPLMQVKGESFAINPKNQINQRSVVMIPRYEVKDTAFEDVSPVSIGNKTADISDRIQVRGRKLADDAIRVELAGAFVSAGFDNTRKNRMRLETWINNQTGEEAYKVEDLGEFFGRGRVPKTFRIVYIQNRAGFEIQSVEEYFDANPEQLEKLYKFVKAKVLKSLNKKGK